MVTNFMGVFPLNRGLRQRSHSMRRKRDSCRYLKRGIYGLTTLSVTTTTESFHSAYLQALPRDPDAHLSQQFRHPNQPSMRMGPTRTRTSFRQPADGSTPSCSAWANSASRAATEPKQASRLRPSVCPSLLLRSRIRPP